MIELWTDGSYNQHTNIGAWAYVINGKKVIEASEAVLEANSSNRMELKAILAGLKSLDNSDTPITVYSDCMDAIRILNNMSEIEQRNWRTIKCRLKSGKLKLGKCIRDLDLWLEIAEFLKTTYHKIDFVWIKGHNGRNEMTLNVKVDKMAQNTRRNYEKIICFNN